MLEDSSIGSQFYKNAAMIQHSILDELENRLAGKYDLSDPINSFNFLLEAASTMAADGILRGEEALNGIYAVRAQTTNDLYKHLSDFDYVGMFSEPASLSLQVLFDRDYIVNNAVQYNDNYNKVVIPKDTLITIGKYNFGLYYPIEIQINRTTNSINVVYDTSEENPLFTLSSNTVNFSEYSTKGLNILYLKFYVYQFNRTVITEDLISSYGFKKEYSFTDKFYAVRAFNIVDGSYEEMSYTLSESIYDPKTPTLRISVVPEDSTVTFNIPQVYFTQGQMGNKLEIVVFTTSGKINTDISEISNDTIVANFAFNYRATTEYSSILNNIPVIIFQPEDTKIVGGSDGYTYEELRSYIINDTLHERIPISTTELTNFFKKKGFSTTRMIDNITDRIYLCHKVLENTEGSPIPVTNAVIYLTKSMLSDINTIVENLDQSITILPTTVYEYDKSTNQCVPLTDAERTALFNLAYENFATAMNAAAYVQSPFHMLLIPDDRYPKVESFNLLNPTATNLTFIRDNITMSSQMTVTSQLLTHNNNGSGGYRLRLGILKQSDFELVDEDSIVVYITTKNTAGSKVGGRATYVGTSDSLSVYDLDISTNYQLSDTDTIGITSLETTSGIVQTQTISLSTDFDIIIAVASGVFSGVLQDTTIVDSLPLEFEGYIGSTRQRITCTFGTSLRSTILNNLDISWSSEQYETYPSDVPELYISDIYETNEDGTLVIDIVNNEVVLNKLHSVGDIIYNEDNTMRIKYPAGSIRYDTNGEPILSKSRELQYYFSCMQFDCRLFNNDEIKYEDYLVTLAETIETYLTIIEEASGHLLERTKLYFRPITTFGTGKFSIGDSVTVSLPLDLSFKIIFYVPTYVYNDAKIQELIKSTTISIIEIELQNEKISMTNVSNSIRTELSDYIESVDVGGIDGDIERQTLIPSSTDVKPTISQYLEYTDGVFVLTKDVTIEYKRAE